MRAIRTTATNNLKLIIMKAIKLTNSHGTMLVNVATIQKVYTDLSKDTKVQLIGMEHYFVVHETIEEIYQLINN
jgi:hypothetical protein